VSTPSNSNEKSGTLITGTDTSIGKTVVACAILAGLRARGIDVAAYKPAETGCATTDAGLVGEDCVRLAAATGGAQSAGEIASYLFELPAAPLVAAEAAGESIEPARLAADYASLGGRCDRVIVEGAGGLLVPVAAGYTYLDLARDLELDVVCVVGSRLGCINHALLTLAALDAAEIPVRGYVINCPTDDAAGPSSTESNRATIARFTRHRDLGLFPHLAADERDDPAALAACAERHFDLSSFV